VNLASHSDSIHALLDSLPRMFAATRTLDSALGPALEAAFQVSQVQGGKVVVVQAALPSLGPGKLKPREGNKNLGADKEHTLLAPDPDSPDANYYKNKAVDFSRQQLSVDFFLFNPNYADVATLGSLSRYTSGQVYWYGGAPYASGFAPAGDGGRFRGDLINDLTRTTAFEAVMRVRATKGVTITNFYGNFFIRGTDLLALPNATPDTAFSVELALDSAESLPVGGVVSVQAALLYTNAAGERRITVHTLARPVTTALPELFRGADVATCANILAKVALDNCLRNGFIPARKYLHKALVDMVRAYRLANAAGALGGLGGAGGGGAGGMGGGAMGINARLPPAQRASGVPGDPGLTPGAPGSDPSTMLPEGLETLPLLVLGLQKCFAYRGGENLLRSDERAALVYRVLSMPVVHSRVFIYPSLYALHDMAPGVGWEGEPAQEALAPPHPCAGARVRKPATVPLTAASLNPGGCFLLDNGVELYLWVGREAPGALVEALFGAGGRVPAAADPTACLVGGGSGSGGGGGGAVAAAGGGGDFRARVEGIIRTLRGDAYSQQRLRFVAQGSGDVNEHRFMCHLVEDPQNFQGGTVSYADYMTLVFKESLMPALGGAAMGGGT
jgi:protein transport protein SEC24